MPAVGPIKRKDLIACLRALGFEPPVSGGEHQYMKGAEESFGSPIPMRRTSGAVCWSASFGRPESGGRNGKRFDGEIQDRCLPAGTYPCLSVDRKSTRLNSSHLGISYAVFCL